jgi:hypothetical protein
MVATRGALSGWPIVRRQTGRTFLTAQCLGIRVAPHHNALQSLASDPESGGNDLVQTFFERSFAINRLRQGPLAGHIDLLAARLATLGYSRVHSRIQLRLVGHFNRWLEQKNLTVEHIDEEIIERYWRYFMRKKRVRSKDVCALMKLLDLLREQGVTPRRTIEAVPTAKEFGPSRYHSSRTWIAYRIERSFSNGSPVGATQPQHRRHRQAR